MSFIRFFRGVIRRLGVWGSVLLTTVFSFFMSVSLTILIGTLTPVRQIENQTITGMWISGVVSLLLTPLISYQFIKLFVQLEASEQELMLLARRDALTNTLNRRFMTEIAEDTLADVTAFPISVIILDIDKFKLINDSYGHLIGDQVLIEFCDAVRSVIRETDLLARFGGDEFILLLPRIDLNRAVGILQRVNSVLKLVDIRDETGDKVNFSLSAGVVNVSQGPYSLRQFIGWADQALYRAKKIKFPSTGPICYVVYDMEKEKFVTNFKSNG